ncbi:IS3 family transposase [Bacillus sp. BGMRC 2118]|nr:IS3 family transposase [Bacillus sp. BGMRC 2118]
MKVNVFKNNLHKYLISAMCKVLQIPRSTYYYETAERPAEDDITSNIIEIFHESFQNYGTRKIKKELVKRGKIVSRRRIGRIQWNRRMSWIVSLHKMNKGSTYVYLLIFLIVKSLDIESVVIKMLY